MSRRIYWKKGMRLTDEVLMMSDNCASEAIAKAMVLGSGGNFGLFPGLQQFSLSVDINKNIIDVVSINCLGITRDGSLIDVQYDTNYTSSFDARTIIPSSNEDAIYLLCISPTKEWRDTNDGMCEQVYSFFVIEENSSVPANALPIARIVYDEYCWRVDDIDFVPPCLFVSSHEKFEELHKEFSRILRGLDLMLPKKLATEQNDAKKIFWPIVQQLAITADKESDFMTPMALLGNVQKYVSGFALACTLDEGLTLAEPEKYFDFVHTPYNCRNAYQTIKEGINLCTLIFNKIEAFDDETPAPKPKSLPSPTISADQLNQSIKTSRFKLTISNVPDGAKLYYSDDGSDPSVFSSKGNVITVDAHFKADRNPEPDKQITIKLRYEKDGLPSGVGSYQINVHKNYKAYICI